MSEVSLVSIIQAAPDVLNHQYQSLMNKTLPRLLGLGGQQGLTLQDRGWQKQIRASGFNLSGLLAGQSRGLESMQKN